MNLTGVPLINGIPATGGGGVPQPLAPANSPTFAGLTLTGTLSGVTISASGFVSNAYAQTGNPAASFNNTHATGYGLAAAGGGAANYLLQLANYQGTVRMTVRESDGLTLSGQVNCNSIGVANNGTLGWGANYGAGIPCIVGIQTQGLDFYPTGSTDGICLSIRWSGITVKGDITTSSTTLHKTNATLTNGAAAAAGTLTNAPVAGNPTKWVPISDNGVTRYIPCW